MVGIVAASVLAGCGGDDGRTALAIDRAEVVDGGIVLLGECADRLEADVSPDPGGSGLTQVTLWGRPRIGRCRARLQVDLVSAPDKIVDGATSMVISVQAEGRAAG